MSETFSSQPSSEVVTAGARRPLDHAGAAAALAHDEAGIGELVQGALGGDARDAEFGAQFLLAGHEVAALYGAAIDAMAQDDEYLVVERDARVGIHPQRGAPAAAANRIDRRAGLNDAHASCAPLAANGISIYH